jgi:hypothetical protein
VNEAIDRDAVRHAAERKAMDEKLAWADRQTELWKEAAEFQQKADEDLLLEAAKATETTEGQAFQKACDLTLVSGHLMSVLRETLDAAKEPISTAVGGAKTDGLHDKGKQTKGGSSMS